MSSPPQSGYYSAGGPQNNSNFCLTRENYFTTSFAIVAPKLVTVNSFLNWLLRGQPCTFIACFMN